MSFKSFILTLVYYSSQFILGPWLAVYFNSFFGLPVFANPVFKIIGIVFVFFGVTIVSYCFYLFRVLGSGTPAPIDPPKKIVCSGIYRYTRNPMYVAYVIVLFGEFMIFGSLLLFFYALSSIIGFHLLVSFWEERKLKDRFGEEYERYAMKVPRWF